MEHVARPVSENREGDARWLAADLSRPWIVANLVGFSIGAAMAGGVLRVIGQPYYGTVGDVMEAARIQAIITGSGAATFGLILGSAQWLVLRGVARAGWWVPATFVGWTVSGVITGFNSGGSLSTIGPDAPPLPPLLYSALAIPLTVALLGAVQWRILNRGAEGAGPWPFVNFGALAIALAAGFGVAKAAPWLADTDFPSPQAVLVVGAVAGPIYAGLTLLFLARLRRRAG